MIIGSKCSATIITYKDFSDITYLVGSNSVAQTQGPVFSVSGSDNSVCPNTVALYLRVDGSGDNWATWGSPTLNKFITNASTPVTYDFITSLTTSGASVSSLG